MYCRVWTILAVVLGACACAHARPGDNHIKQSIPKDNVSCGKTCEEVREVEVTSGWVKNEEVKAEKVQVEHGKTDEVKTVQKPVNERYPHAVLFGGTCGGTIIHPQWVLTAGHCTLFTGGRYVVAGTNNTEEGGVTRNVKRLVIHPQFSVGPYWLDADQFNIKQVAARWDFLLAELSEPLPLDGKTMVAATLDDKPSIPEGLDADYAGYGTEHHGGTMRSEMHGMELSTQPDSVCSSLEQYHSEDMLCAKGRPPRFDSACNGDSGSGLVGDGRLLGVASWVENDAHECFPGALVVFSRVAAVRDWIRNVTNV